MARPRMRPLPAARAAGPNAAKTPAPIIEPRPIVTASKVPSRRASRVGGAGTSDVTLGGLGSEEGDGTPGAYRSSSCIGGAGVEHQESTRGRRDALAQVAVDGELDAGGERCLERQEQHRARDLLGVFVDALAAHFDE